MDVVEVHRRTVERWVELVRGAAGSDWSGPTPCSAWDVRELVNHITGEERWVVPLLQGRTVGDVGDALDGDLLGDDPPAAAVHAAREAVAAFDAPGAADRTVALSFGPTAAQEYAAQLAADHLVHGWDLAVATGQDRPLPPELVESVAAWFAGTEAGYRAAGVVGDAVPAAPGASAQERLLCAFGRDPDWSS